MIDVFHLTQKQKAELRKENEELRQKAKLLKKDLENAERRNGCKFNGYHIIET